MIRSLFLKVEPFVFRALKPLLSGTRARFSRSLLIQKYCRGRGAEIGAGVQPGMVPVGSRTTYIDAVPASYWRERPQWAHKNVLEADIIDEGETLATIPDETFDYLLAFHVLEHIPDPLRALKNWIRVVKRGGHVLVAVPDMRVGDERDRRLTTIEHFLRDHEAGPEVSASEHYQELSLNPQGLTGESLREHIKQHERMIHYHTFTLSTLMQLLSETEYFGYQIVEGCFNVNEDLVVLRKT